jgi:transcriptional regulator GlxA family with amidase domain
MRKITFLIPNNVPLSSLAVPLDVFMAAGVFWNQLFNLMPKPLFNTKTVTIDGNPVQTVDGLEIKPDGSIHDAVDSDTIIIAPTSDPLEIQSHEAIPWLRESHNRGTHIASICTGAFLLAETGLLNQKTATTHWGYINEFKRMYPEVSLQPEKMITDEGDLFCSGGANAGGDLSLYLLGIYSGKNVAFQTARSLIMDVDRKSQLPYYIFRSERSHGDEKIADIQDWIEKNYSKETRVDFLAKLSKMSRRTFERRFKSATGVSPLRYLQMVRIEKAKDLLENGHKTFDEITYHVGYEDSSTFGRVFKHRTGLSPHSYKKKYNLNFDVSC